jgi:hypothetical protein
MTRKITKLLPALLLGFNLLASSAAAQDQSNTDHISRTTLDGVAVHLVPVSKERLESNGQEVAYASYNNAGAFVYYDVALFSKLSPMARAFILEHEYAHHSLGHTLSTRFFRDAQISIPNDHVLRKEDDADCAAAFALEDQFGAETKDIRAMFMHIFMVRTNGFAGSSEPFWLDSRTENIETRLNAGRDQGYPRPFSPAPPKT